MKMRIKFSSSIIAAFDKLTAMNKSLKAEYDKEISLYKSTAKSANFSASWNHLERAHILGQFFVMPHLETHWLMLLLAARTFNLKEFILQIPRLVLAAPGSWTGRAPEGNPGTGRIGISHQVRSLRT